MLRVTKCRKKIIPSALHIDNTARVQTVNKKEILIFIKLSMNFTK